MATPRRGRGRPSDPVSARRLGEARRTPRARKIEMRPVWAATAIMAQCWKSFPAHKILGWVGPPVNFASWAFFWFRLHSSPHYLLCGVLTVYNNNINGNSHMRTFSKWWRWVFVEETSTGVWLLISLVCFQCVGLKGKVQQGVLIQPFHWLVWQWEILYIT